jgi:predicted MFS family arabinose efflux permease
MRSGVPSLGIYAAILRTSGVGVPVVGTTLASLPIGMLSLAVLLLTAGHGGGFAIAGGVVALLGIGTGTGIALQGRMMDRFGLSRVLLIAVTVQLLALLGLVAAIKHDTAVWLIGTAAFAAGLGEPQVGGCLRALWPTLLPPEYRAAATALSSIVFELPVVAGPLVLAAALLVLPPEAAVLLAGALFLVGACLVAASRAARAWTPVRSRNPGLLGPLVSARLRRVLIVAAAQGAATGLLQVSCAAFVANRGDANAAVGVLYACLSGGSLLGTIAYGTRRWSGSSRGHIGVLTALLALVLAAAAFAPGPVVLGTCVLLAGLLIGPVVVGCFTEAERSAPTGMAVTAFTSLTAVGLAGSAGGTALAGQLVDSGGTLAALLTAAALVAAGTIAMAMRVNDRPG